MEYFSNQRGQFGTFGGISNWDHYDEAASPVDSASCARIDNGGRFVSANDLELGL